MSTKYCTHCKQEKPVSEFGTRVVNGKRYPTTNCAKCKYERSKPNRVRRYSENDVAYNRDRDARRKQERAAGTNLAQYVWEDCRKSDRKRGFENDLDREFIREKLACACSYCGDTETRMTLDRIVNTKGHTKDNVVPACYRCNLIRRDMPYEAWLMLVDALRAARLQGLFGEWGKIPIARRT